MLRPFPVLLDDAVVLTRRGPLSLALLIAVPLVFVNAGWAALSSWFALGSAASADPTFVFGSCGAMVVAFPIFLVGQLVAYGMLGTVATLRALGREATAMGALRFVCRPRTIGTLLLTSLLLVASMVALVFPFFVVSALVSFLFPVMLEEGRFGTDAIARSCSLAWRNPRRLLGTWPLLLIAGIHAVFFAISTGLSLAAQAPIQVIQQVATFRASLGGDGDPSALLAVLWLQVPLAAVTAVTSVIAGWYLFGCLAIYFLDTRERREATSLERAIASWEHAPAAPSPAPSTATPPSHGAPG
jgi:hypothetical protein